MSQQPNSLEKVAILLLSLGEELAGEILAKLPRNEAQQIVQALSKLRNVDHATVHGIQDEFRSLLIEKSPQLPEGAAFVKRVLKRTFDDSTSARFLDSLPRDIPQSFKDAELVDSKQLHRLLSREHHQTIALILGHLSPRKSSEIISFMHPQTRSDVLLRLATLQEVDHQVLDDLDKTLSQMLVEANKSATRQLGGPAKTAQILTFMSAEQRKDLLTQIESTSAQLAGEVKAGLFTFEDIAKLDRLDVEKIIAKAQPQDLELALRKCSEILVELFFSAMSERRAEQLKENIASTKPVALTKVVEAQRKIAALASELIASGQLRDPMEEAV